MDSGGPARQHAQFSWVVSTRACCAACCWRSRCEHCTGCVRGTLPSVAIPFLVLWVAAPAIAWRISQTPPAAAKSELTDGQQRELRLIARRTWRFFETFVTAEDNHLPPDNFQEDPRAVDRAPDLSHQYRAVPVVHRRGPRLRLVRAARCAGSHRGRRSTRCRGWPRFHGHLYNWYDTQDLRPLEPRYVSSVDSGNLAAHLITLAGAFREWQQNPRPTPRRPSRDSPTPSTWRVKRCASSRSCRDKPSRARCSKRRSRILKSALRPRDRTPGSRGRRSRHCRGTCLDTGRPGARARE